MGMAVHVCRLVADTSSPTLMDEVRRMLTIMYPELTNIRLIKAKQSGPVWKTPGRHWYNVTFEADWAPSRRKRPKIN